MPRKKKEGRTVAGVFQQRRHVGTMVWSVEYYDAHNLRHRPVVGTHEAAVNFKNDRDREKREWKNDPEAAKLKMQKPKGPDPLLKELLADAMENARHENGASAVSNLQGIINLIEPEFGTRPASSITTDEFQKFLRKKKLEKEWEDGTYNHYITQLRLTYRLAMASKKVSVNPALELKRKTLNNAKPRYLKLAEENAFLEFFRLHPEHFHAFQFARKTGLRAGMQFTLRWTQIDFDRRTLTIPPRKNSKYRKKTHILPLNPTAFTILVDLKARSHGSPFVFSEYQGIDTSLYSIRPADWFPEIVEAAGVEEFTWHSLRHDFASQMVMRGTPLPTVQRLMCHASLKQTAIYADLAPDHVEGAVASLDAPLPIRVVPTATSTATRQAVVA